MSIELRIAGLIISFLLFGLVGLYHVVRMMNRHQYQPVGGYYQQPMVGGYDDGKKTGLPTSVYLTAFVIIALGLLILPDFIGGGSTLPEDSLLYLQTGYTPSKSRLVDGIIVPDRFAPKEPTYRSRPDPFDDMTPLANDNYPSRSQVSSRLPQETTAPDPVALAPRFGYQIKCSSVASFAIDAPKDYLPRFPQAKIYEKTGECRYKLVLFVGATKEEINRMKSRTPNLPKGFIVALPQ